MPLYEYIDESNDEVVEIYLHADEADDIGAIRNENGRRLRRIFSQVSTKIDNGFVSRQVHRWHPDVKHHTKEGWAAFNNKREAREFIARNNAKEGSTTDWSLDN
jgi:hypothetical protein